jgi:hypothetical protein
MKKILFITLFCFLTTATTYPKTFDDDLSPFEMERVTTEILVLFTSPDKDKLRDYISEKWLEKEGLDVKAFTINSYSPNIFNILFSTSDIVVVEIGRENWKHVLIFKFINEDGEYRAIPKGISRDSDDYIDPWWDIKEYICVELIDPDYNNHDFEK